MRTRWIVTALAVCLTGTGALSAQDPVGAANRNPADTSAPSIPGPPVVQSQRSAQDPTRAPVLNTSPTDVAGATRPTPRAPNGSYAARAQGVAGFDILVYDDSTVHSLAQRAANNISPLGTVVADASDFNSLLGARPWDLVAVDCPSNVPSGGWGPLISHVRGGGRVVMSFWDWDNSTPSAGDPGLPPAFEVAVARSFSITGQTLFDSGALPVFAGVTMPNADWHGHFGDDGDEFDPLGAAVGLAHIGTASTPVIVRGSHTIAALVIDEAGDTWLRDGSGVRLWENMMFELLAQLDVLVYDHDTQHSLARQAAANLSPFGVMVAGQSTFNSQLASRRWDVVVVDCPNLSPTGGWGPFIGYVRSGGKTVMSFWDWDNDSGFGDPALPAAFDVLVVPPPPSFSLLGQTLQDSGSSPVFHDVTMPNMDWHNHWGDDGDQFRLLGGTTGLAHVGNPQTPVIVRSRNRQAIAALVIDEAGDTWLGDNSAVRLWENLIKDVLSETDILVYDDNTNHQLAQIAAMDIDPFGTVVADESNFGGLLASHPWDLVAMDCPSNVPTTGWTGLISWVNGGGKAILSFWDWDNDSTSGDPALPGAFDVVVSASFSWAGQTLFDSGTTTLFAGVTMPNADWHDHWGDDGDEFVPIGSAVGVGHIGNPTLPVLVRGNSGRTIAAPEFDEAGDTWLGDGSGVQLWSNMMHELLGGCPSLKAVESIRLGAPPNPPALLPGVTGGPILGAVWDPRISHATFLPGAVGDVLALGVFPVNIPSPYGTLLCDLAGPVIFLSGPPGARFPIPVPPNCALIGGDLCLQGISSDGAVIRLTNALDVTIGTF